MMWLSDVKPKATRQSFGEALAECGARYSNVVVLDADLAKSTKSELFAKAFPQRFFEMGIAEANMIGTAAGLAFTGKVPFLCSFGCFLTGRYDQIRLSVAYSLAGVRLVGTHAGVGIGDDGHSQMGIEDVGLMRGLPKMAVLQPADDEEAKQMVEFLATGASGYDGPAYLRLTRQNLPAFHEKNYRFQFGKLDVLRTAPAGAGPRVTLFGSGAGLEQAAIAAKVIEEKGWVCDLVNIHSIKPLDVEGLRALLSRGGSHTWASVEDHSVLNGLGSALAEFLAEAGAGHKLMRFGVQDLFGESGEGPELYEKFGLNGTYIGRQILEA